MLSNREANRSFEGAFEGDGCKRVAAEGADRGLSVVPKAGLLVNTSRKPDDA